MWVSVTRVTAPCAPTGMKLAYPFILGPLASHEPSKLVRGESRQYTVGRRRGGVDQVAHRNRDPPMRSYNDTAAAAEAITNCWPLYNVPLPTVRKNKADEMELGPQSYSMQPGDNTRTLS